MSYGKGLDRRGWLRRGVLILGTLLAVAMLLNGGSATLSPLAVAPSLPHGTSVLGAGGMGSGAARVGPRPFTGGALTILSFSFSPNDFVETTSNTTVSVSMSGGPANLSFAYIGLPPGCPSENASSFTCTPLANGTFPVELTVTAPGGNSSTANATLTVFPWAVGDFLAESSRFDDPPRAEQPCEVVNASPFFTTYCYQQESSPNLLVFPNGTLGVLVSETTRSTTDLCPGASKATVSRLELSLSTDGGISFGRELNLGGRTCAFLNALEPSFAVSATGAGYGVFVLENSTAVPGSYANRSGDALGFVSSTSNGSTWSAPVLLSAAGTDVARPQLAVFGDTIYVGYEQLANSTVPIPGGATPIAINFTVSTDGGQSWSSPRQLPGLNASQGYDAMSPSLAVNATGTLAVSYATDRSCVDAGRAGSCFDWGESVVSVTSSNNGTTWSSPSVVAGGVGESSCPLGSCRYGLFQSSPQTSIAFAPSGELYVGYSGTYDQNGTTGSSNYRYTGAFAALSMNLGTSWSRTAVGLMDPGYPENFTNVAVGVSGSRIYVTYSSQNGSWTGGPFVFSYSQWLAEAVVGGALDLAPPTLLGLLSMPPGVNTNATEDSYVGYSSGLAFDGNGAPLVAYSLPAPAEYSTASSSKYFYANYTYPTNLTIAYPAVRDTPVTVNVTFLTSGLPENLSWGFQLQAQNFSTNATEIELFNVPRDVYLPFALTPVPVGSPALKVLSPPTASIGPLVVFSTDLTVLVTFNDVFELNLSLVPYFPAGGGTYTDVDLSVDATSPGPSSASASYEIERESSPNFDFNSTTYGYVSSNPYLYNDSYFDCDYNVVLGTYSCFGYFTNCTSVNCTYGSLSAPPLGFLPVGSSFPLHATADGDSGVPAAGPFLGSGAGSYSGPLNLTFSQPDRWAGVSASNVVMDSAVNETLYLGSIAGSSATYNVSAEPYGLPPGTTYLFDWNGTAYRGVSPQPVIIRNQSAGGYLVTEVSANGSAPGWERFGSVNPPGPVVVPYHPSFNLSFTSYEEVAVAPHPVAFRATQLSPGTPWTLRFNGSSYASSSGGLNLTLHPGTYAASADPATAPDGNSVYAAPAFGPNVTIGPNTTVLTVAYAPTFRVSVYASTGGTVAGAGGGGPASSITLWLLPDSRRTFTAEPSPGWSFLGWTGVGSGSYSGADPNATVSVNSTIEESAGFEPLPGARFNLTFLEVGLPVESWWGVDLGGVGYSTDQPTLIVGNLYPWGAAGGVGRYPLTVPYAYLNSTNLTRFVPNDFPALVGTNGSLTPQVVLQFAPQNLATAFSSAGGTALWILGGTPSGGTLWVNVGTPLQLQETSETGFTFAAWVGTGAGSYSGALPSPSVIVSGEGVSEYAVFVPTPPPVPPSYTLTVARATPLAAGTVWSFSLRSPNGTAVLYATEGPNVTVADLSSGTYLLTFPSATSADGLTRYAPESSNPSSVTLKANRTITVGYRASFWVDIVPSTGGATAPAGGWYAAGANLTLSAVPESGYQFVTWVGSGAGAYSGPLAAPSVVVTGPISELAQFEPVAPSPPSTAPATLWQNHATLAALAAIGLLVGALVGLLLFRRRSDGSELEPDPSTSEAPPSSEPAPWGEGPGEEETPPEGGEP